MHHPDASPDRSRLARLVRAWLLIGVVDGCWAIVLTRIYGRSQARLWQGIAATAFGETMFDGGWATVALGIVMHFGVALAWTVVFFLLVTRSAWLRRVLESPRGVLEVAAVYGPLIWVVMSLVVIPLLVHKPTAITWRWWIQLAGHIVFVGVPIVWGIGRAGRRSRAPATS